MSQGECMSESGYDHCFDFLFDKGENNDDKVMAKKLKFGQMDEKKVKERLREFVKEATCTCNDCDNCYECWVRENANELLIILD
jgi:lipoate synthase